MEGKSWRTPNPAPEKISAEYEADVVILGGGQAGTCAAAAATEEGASVIVIEKKTEKRMGYNGGGQVGQINSEFAKSKGVPEVDVVEFINDWQLRSNNRANTALISKFAHKSGECFDWIVSRLTDEQRADVQIRQVTPDGQVYNAKVSQSGIKTWVGCVCLQLGYQAVAMNALRNESIERGAKWFFGSTGWLLEKENGRVTALIAKTENGEFIRCKAKKGVLLSAGDFGADAEMVRDLCTEAIDYMPEATPRAFAGCDGTGVKLGVWAGGKLEPRPLSSMGGSYTYPGGSPADPIGTTAALWLNAHGKRYCNEGFGDVVLSGIQSMRQPKGILSVVFDSKIFDQVKAQAPGHLSFDYTSEQEISGLQQLMDKAMGKIAGDVDIHMGAPKTNTAHAPGGGMPPMPGGPGDGPGGPGGGMPPMGDMPGGPGGGMPPMDGGPGGPGGPDGGPGGGPGGPGGAPGRVTLVGSDTLEGLADKLGYSGKDKENFLASVARYNELCYAKRDEDFGKEASLLFPIDTAPYYGYCSEKSLGAFMCTTGGLLTDENQNVLDSDYEPIPGLFASGNTCGGRFGPQYSTPVSGISIGIAQTLGREAGIYIASL